MNSTERCSAITGRSGSRRRTVGPAFLFLLALILAPGCRTESSIKGALKLDIGQAGDLRRARVELYTKQDMSEPPIAGFLTDSGAVLERAVFHSPSIPAGVYYLLGWQDVNRDGLVNNSDLVGVSGAKYRQKYAGEPLVVTAGNTTDVGDITVYALREPVKSATGERTNSGTVTRFSYVCYHDLTLHSLSIAFPGLGTFDDPLAPGPKTRGETYLSEGWESSGEPMPEGEHILTFRGEMDAARFEVRIRVAVE